MPVQESRAREEVAIIGMAGRFPGAKSLAEFWRNLRNGVESITQFSEAEICRSMVNAEDPRDPDYVRAGTVLGGVEMFDAPFFGLSAREAEITDPQHRLFLECAWEALEDAGCDPSQYPGPIGVFASAGPNRYVLNNLLCNPAVLRTQNVYQLVIANERDYIGTRVSYALNLGGPSLTVQTACSSSLVAIHLAAQSLLGRECDTALAGGVSLRIPEHEGDLYRPGGIVSPDGHTRAFDARGAGTMFTSGIGIVVLKRLSDALADGDRIRAVLKGSAINNDGAAKTGYTAPSLDGQAAVIARALEVAGVAPETITFVEAHGTATATGDPIEVGALTKVFRAHTQKRGFCALGTVKTNVGHPNAAAGVAGVIKTVLALEHGELPPSLNFERPNPRIPFAESPFYVNRTLSEWTSAAGPRRAGVSSFGIGGTNAHAILEEAPAGPPSGPSRPWQLLLLSARSPSALDAAAGNLATHLEQNAQASLADVCYTLKAGRKAFRHRRAAVCRTVVEAVGALRGQFPERVLSGVVDPGHRSVVFMFPGQASEHVNMARDLYREEAEFRETVDRCSELLKPRLGVDLREVIYPPAGQEAAAAEELERSSVAQPAMFVFSYALAKLWMAWGIRPDTVIGYSTGELAAACVAGVFSLEDALAVIAERGLLVESVPAGVMLAVALPERELAPHLAAEGLSLAVVGGPNHCVASGLPEAVAALEETLKGARVACRRLQSSRAFHSEMLDPILPAFAQVMARAKLSPPGIPFVSTLMGAQADSELVAPAYWVRQLREPVRFAQAIGPLLKDPGTVLLEVGPGRVLADLVRRLSPRNARPVVFSSCRHPEAPSSDAEVLLDTLGKLWLVGVQADWRAFYARERRRRVPLPSYPFERQRYWVEPQAPVAGLMGRAAPTGKKADVADWFYVPSWKRLPLAPHGEARGASPWLVFCDEGGLGAELAAHLEQEGHAVAVVSPGERFAQVRGGGNVRAAYTVDPKRPEDYVALFRGLAAANAMPAAIAHLWSVGGQPSAWGDAGRFERVQDLGYYSLLAIAKALATEAVAVPIRLHMVSSGVQAVTCGADELLRPESATLLGPCKVIPQEYPNITCRSIDIQIPDAGTPRRHRLAEQLLAEVTSAAPDRVVAYRGGHRWVQAFEPIRIEQQAAGKGLLRLEGVYLITGGLGHIGLVLAEHLARSVRARLVLIGRSGLPPHAAWPQWVSSHAPDDTASHRIRRVQELERLGAEALVLRANVADEAQMRQAVARAGERFGAIHGVFHAAGMLENTAFADIPRLGRRETEAHFEPKVRGLLVLDKVLDGVPLDFCLLLSSIASVLGGLAYCAYAAANAFLDAFAQKRNQAGSTPWISVNWDSWQGSKAEARARASVAEFALTDAEGLDAFQRVLATRGLGQIVVSTGDLQGRIDQWVEGGSAREAAAPREAPPSALHPRPELLTAYVPPADDTQRAIADVWRELLGIERVGIHDDFFELGGHSLLATQVASRLRRTLRAELPVGTFFASPTIAGLADRVRELRSASAPSDAAGKLLDEIEALGEEEAQRLLREGGGPDDVSGPPATP